MLVQQWRQLVSFSVALSILWSRAQSKLQSELDVFDKEMGSLIVLRDDVKDQTELAEKEGKV